MEGMNCVRAAIKVGGNKGDRGFAHPVMGRLLCPLKYPASDEYVFILYLCFDISKLLLEFMQTHFVVKGVMPVSWE